MEEDVSFTDEFLSIVLESFDEDSLKTYILKLAQSNIVHPAEICMIFLRKKYGKEVGLDFLKVSSEFAFSEFFKILGERKHK